MPRPTREECTAYHEAGHAIAAIRFGKPIVKVSIVTSVDTNNFGHVEFRPMPPAMAEALENGSASLRVCDWIEKEAIVYFAGGIAEATFKGHKKNLGTWGDHHGLVDLVGRICGSIEETEALAKLLFIRAKQFVTAPHNWPIIEHFAKTLLIEKEMSGRRARIAYREALRDAINKQKGKTT